MKFETIIDTTANPNESLLYGESILVIRETSRDGHQWFEVSQGGGVPSLTAAEWAAVAGACK